MRIWAVTRKKQHKLAEAVIQAEHQGDWSEQELLETLGEACVKLDLARPVLLKKHVDEANRFHRVVFTKHDFVEPVHFDKLEAELIDDEKDVNTPVYNPLYD